MKAEKAKPFAALAKRGGALLAAGALAFGAVGIGASQASAAAKNVDDAVFTWQVSKETSGGAFFGGCNFMVAGKAGDFGKSGVWDAEFGAANYKTEEGNVTITRPNADSSEQVQPTWDKKCIDNRTGNAVRPFNPNQTTDYNTGDRVNISGGVGTVDAEANTASIQWDGDFTLVFYGGMTYWSISDVKLEVTNGTGKLTGTASGYGSDMYDTAKWVTLDEQQIDLATFSGADLDETGAIVSVDYLGVEIDSTGGMSEQVRTGANWGAFPQSWVNFNKQTGQSSYWYSSGGTLDPKKPALPFQLSYTLQEPAVDVELELASGASQADQRTEYFVGEDAGFAAKITPAGENGTVKLVVNGNGQNNAEYATRYIAAAESYAATVPGLAAGTYEVKAVFTPTDASKYNAAESNTVTIKVKEAPAIEVVGETTDLDPEGETTVTVKGKNFLPHAPTTTGVRPPLQGKFTGAYVVFGNFAENWKPSAGAASSTRSLIETKWAVSAEDINAVGGASRGAIVLNEDGTFETTLTLKKNAAKELANGNYGIYTYAAGGAVFDKFEHYVPVTFAAPVVDPTAAVSAPSVEQGEAVTFSGADFPANTEVTFAVDGETVGTANSNDEGAVSLEWTVPADYAVGNKTVTLTAGDKSASAEFAVTEKADDPADEVEPTVAANSASVKQGEEITFTGANFAADTTVTATVNGETVGTATSDSEGKVEIKWTVPADYAVGNYTVTFNDGAKSAEAEFAVAAADVPTPVNPTAAVSAASAKQGQEITFNGANFAAGSEVTFTVYSDPVVAGTAVAQANGDVTLTWTVPANFEVGNHTVVLTNSAGQEARATFAVTAAADNGGNNNGGTDNGNTDNGNTDSGNTDNGGTNNANTATVTAKAVNGKSLAVTGAQSQVVPLVAAAALLIAGATVIAARRKRLSAK